jgi:hypothetical protein
MASQYQQPFAIPEGLPLLIKDLTREVLREQVRGPAASS